MNTNVVPAQQQPVETEVLDPQQVSRRNQDLMKITLALVALITLAVVSLICSIQTSSAPPFLP